jgi:hypothetical protein
MKASELEWHKNQAQQIRETEHAVRKGEQTLAFYWWQVGERLNAVYGFGSKGGGKDGSTREGNIPFLDMEEIAGIYGVSRGSIQKARQFNKLANDQTEALRVIDEYGNWRVVRDGFLPGHSADEAKKRTKDRNDKHVAKMTAALRSHIMNVDDDIRDALILNGLSDDETRDAIRLFIRQSGWRQIKLVWDNREQLREWRRMQA